MAASPYGHRVVTLKGHPHVGEEGSATAAIKPGFLVQGHLSVAPHATAAGDGARNFALERDEMGTGIDATYPGIGTQSQNYAIGDQVKVGAFHQGDRVCVWVNSGVSVTDGVTFLESAGDGTLRAYTSGVKFGLALETVAAVAATRINIEVM